MSAYDAARQCGYKGSYIDWLSALGYFLPKGE